MLHLQRCIDHCYITSVQLCRRSHFNPKKSESSENRDDGYIEKVQSYKYLGVYICNDLRWNKTVDLVVGKANRSLGLLRRNFSSCSQQIREKLYFALVRPHLEYACEVWSLHTAELKPDLSWVIIASGQA